MIRGQCRNGPLHGAVLLVMAAVSLALVGGCGREGGGGGDGRGKGKGKGGPGVVDSLLGRGVGEFAEGRWRCVNDINDGPDLSERSGSAEYDPAIFRRRVVSTVAITSDGRFSYMEDDPRGVVGGSGTWSVEGLRLRLAIPWRGEGRTGFYRWVHEADADPPTHVEGTGPFHDNGKPPDQELDVEVGKDRIRIVQKDKPGYDGPNYDWDVTCTRESTEPGEIPAAVPPSDGEDVGGGGDDGVPAATTAPGGS